MCSLCSCVFVSWTVKTFPCSLKRFKQPRRGCAEIQIQIFLYFLAASWCEVQTRNRWSRYLYHDVKHQRIIKKVFWQQHVIFIHPWSTKSFLPSCYFRNRVQRCFSSQHRSHEDIQHWREGVVVAEIQNFCRMKHSESHQILLGSPEPVNRGDPSFYTPPEMSEIFF